MCFDTDDGMFHGIEPLTGVQQGKVLASKLQNIGTIDLTPFILLCSNICMFLCLASSFK